MTRVKKIPFEKFCEIYSQVTRLTVEVVVYKKGKILLTKRNINPYKGYWHIPGGTVLFGETILQTIKRVAQEELGMKVKNIKLLDYIEYPNEGKMGDYPRWTIGLAILTEGVFRGINKNKQGEDIKFFKTLPKKIIFEQSEFLKKKFSDLRTGISPI